MTRYLLSVKRKMIVDTHLSIFFYFFLNFLSGVRKIFTHQRNVGFQQMMVRNFNLTYNFLNCLNFLLWQLCVLQYLSTLKSKILIKLNIKILLASGKISQHTCRSNDIYIFLYLTMTAVIIVLFDSWIVEKRFEFLYFSSSWQWCFKLFCVIFW